MTRLRFIGAVALAAMSLLAVSAGAASAAKLVLRTEKGGEVLAPGTAVGAEAFFPLPGECYVAGSYELATNSSGTDKLKNAKALEAECFNGSYSVSGAIEEVKLSAKGVQKYKLSPKIALTVPGPCVYEFSSFTGSFGVPYESFAYSNTSVTGKINKKVSLGGCAATMTTSVELEGASSTYGEVL